MKNHSNLLKKLKEIIQLFGDKILNESVDKDGNFELIIQRGSYTVAISKNIKNNWLQVSFPSPFKDEDVLKLFDEQVEKNPDFLLNLQSFLTSSVTAYNTLNDNGKFVGFLIIKRMFINGDNIPIQGLEDAIVSVVSTGSLGFQYIATCVGNKKLEQKIIEEISKPDPEHMFG
jgi:hypothetical protein